MDINVVSYKELPVPEELLKRFETTEEDKKFINNSRLTIQDILTKKSDKKLVIIGPCSIHDYDLAFRYAKLLKSKFDSYKNLFLVMRVYFEKPRSRTGWKGFIYDPDLDDSCNIEKGLNLARSLLLELTKLKIPIGFEFLDVITPQYLSDLVSWGAIGARTSESQVHRQLASGLSVPIGFKNLTDGNIKKAIDGVISSNYPHSFLGFGYNGKPYHIETKGNKYSHLILRGGDDGINYVQEKVNNTINTLKKEKIETGIIVDCSHANSNKDYKRQILTCFSVARQMRSNENIVGVMIESNLYDGKQELIKGKELKDGISITDSCIGWDMTVAILNEFDIKLNEIDIHNSESLKKMRELVAMCEPIILTKELRLGELPSPVKDDEFIITYDNDLYDLVSQCDISLYPILHRRLSYAQRIAKLKFYSNQFDFMIKKNDLLHMITDFSVEREILRRTNTLPISGLFEKIISLMKKIQCEYISYISENKKIGYLGGKGSFSHECLENVRGKHIAFPNMTEMTKSFIANEIDYVMVPVYNSLIGDIYRFDNGHRIGSLQHKIELDLMTNREVYDIKLIKKLYIQEIVLKEVHDYVQKLNMENIIITKTTTESCIKAISDTEPCFVICSASNKSNYLHIVESNISDHNYTHFEIYTN